jgi:aminoglycoside 3-N-acetyltransferase
MQFHLDEIFMPHTKETLLHDLKNIGVCPGDRLFIHSSFKSLEPVEGGAETVVIALKQAVESDGLVLMPSFNLKGDFDERAAAWDPETSPSTVGWLTEYFRSRPDTLRSDHYSHSVAAWGGEVKRYIAGHLSQEGLRSPWDRIPWGKTYGTHSPMFQAYNTKGKLLMLGVDYWSSTCCRRDDVLQSMAYT